MTIPIYKGILIGTIDADVVPSVGDTIDDFIDSTGKYYAPLKVIRRRWQYDYDGAANCAISNKIVGAVLEVGE